MGVRARDETVQIDDIDDRLANGLWTAFLVFFARSGNMPNSPLSRFTDFEPWAKLLWTEFFGQALDSVPGTGRLALGAIRKRWQDLDWNEAYEFVEFLAERSENDKFVKECNRVLERDRSAYRFAGYHLVRIADERDLAAVQRALDDTLAGNLGPMHHQLDTAVQLFGDRTDPDYRNSIKESISAVEGVVNLINGKPGTLGTAIKKVDPRLHPALEEALQKLYGWTSDGDGIRHALMDEPDVGFEEAQFMLVLCSGFVSFLVAKAAKAGLL